MCSVVSIQLRKNALNSLLHGVLRYGELIRNLLVRVAGGDEAQHDDFCCQGQITHMLGDLERELGRIGGIVTENIPAGANPSSIRQDVCRYWVRRAS